MFANDILKIKDSEMVWKTPPFTVEAMRKIFYSNGNSVNMSDAEIYHFLLVLKKCELLLSEFFPLINNLFSFDHETFMHSF